MRPLWRRSSCPATQGSRPTVRRSREWWPCGPRPCDGRRRTGDDVLYRPEPPQVESVSLTAVPYCFWDNRQPGEMRIWLHDRG